MMWHPLLYFTALKLFCEILLVAWCVFLLIFFPNEDDMGLFHFGLNTVLTDSKPNLPCTFHQLQDIAGYFPPMTFLSQVPQIHYWGKATTVKESRNAYRILQSSQTNIRGKISHRSHWQETSAPTTAPPLLNKGVLLLYLLLAIRPNVNNVFYFLQVVYPRLDHWL